MSHRQYSMENILPQNEENLLYLTLSSYDAKWQSMPHTHSFCELFFITEGEGYFFFNKQSYPIRKNHLIIVNPHVLHTESIDDNQLLSYTVLGIENLSFEVEDKAPSSLPPIYDLTQQDNDIPLLLDLMTNEVKNKNEHYETVMQHYLKAMLIKLADFTHRQFRTLPTTKINNECFIIKEYINANYNQNITLEDLAKLTHRSRFNISRNFSETFGISPMHYLAEIRILAAKNLLATSDFSIQQIVEMTGFSSTVYFSQSFKKSTGLSPREFRKQASQKSRQ